MASQPLTSSNDIFAVEDLGALEGHHDPLGLESQSSSTTLPSGAAPQVRSGMQHNPYARQPVAAKGMSSGLVIGLAAGGGALVLLLIVAVVVGTMMMGGNDRADVSQNDAVPQRPTSPTVRVEQTQTNRGTLGAGQLAGSPLKGNGAGNAGGGTAETDIDDGSDATTPVSTDGTANTSSQLASVSTLAKVAPNWAFAANAKRAGTRKAGDGELVILHYSWMVELLPELGHQKVYDRFNFEKSWTEPENQVVCHELIPQFLNPLDSRERLEDPRFPAFAVTHFSSIGP